VCRVVERLILISVPFANAQPVPQPSETPPAVPTDTLGRTTPRGTVLGFLAACGKGDFQAASQYLNTRLHGKASETLAQQLFVVLNRRLPARLNEVSDRPEGSLPFPSKPNQDLIGTIETADGSFDILVERLDRGKAGSIWLFAAETLKLIPQLYQDVNGLTLENVVPAFLIERKIIGIPLFEWLAVFVGLPGLYFFGALLNRLLSPPVGRMRRWLRKQPSLPDPEFLPPPVRLLLMALIVRWTLSKIDLPLLARQFWSGLVYVVTILACVWLLISLNGRLETYFRRRLDRRERTGAISVLRFARRTADLLVIFVGVLAGLYYFRLNPTAAIAGLGVGGIAVALAAQKTLENVIGGMSLIFDHSVHVGELLNVSGAFGVVEDIGLRSTRIRTLDRTLVCVPNGHLANLTLENVSRRDKFWFHPRLNLRFETTASEMHSVLEGISRRLAEHPLVESGSFRVNLLNFGASSFEVEIFAYLFAENLPHFLKLQGDLLLQVMEIIEKAGTQIALPSQTMYFAVPSESGPDAQGVLKAKAHS